MKALQFISQWERDFIEAARPNDGRTETSPRLSDAFLAHTGGQSSGQQAAVAAADMWVTHIEGDEEAAIRALAQALAWLRFGHIESPAIRNEAKTRLTAYLKAATLDGLNGMAWRQMHESCRFDPELDRAIRDALSIAKANQVVKDERPWSRIKNTKCRSEVSSNSSPRGLDKYIII